MVQSKRSITLGTLEISEKGKQYVNAVLDTNRLSAGPFTKRLEEDFASEHGCDHGVFCNSGTSALQIALAAMKELYGYHDGDEVIVPATTFIATSNIVIQNNMVPVFVDVDPNTFNIDPSKIEAAITGRTRAIIPVHLFGLPADMPAIMAIAAKHGLQVIEDSCETMFAWVDGQSVGSFGHAACFSTYVAHLIVGGVGGFVTTSDWNVKSLCRSLMTHGRDNIYTNIDADNNADDTLLKRMIERRYSFDRVGYSYRCTELEAAIALSELERWPVNIATRRLNAMYLTERLKDLRSVLQLPVVPQGYEHSFMMYPMVLSSLVNRDEFLLHLEKNGIETRLLFPLLSTPVYRELFPGEEDNHPVAKKLGLHGFFIGMHQGLDVVDMDYVSDVIHGYFASKL